MDPIQIQAIKILKLEYDQIEMASMGPQLNK